MNHPVEESGTKPHARRKPVTMALMMIVVIIGFFMLREHWGHVAGLWPYLLLLACPLMHLFHGHGGGHAGHHGPDKSSSGS